MSIKKRIISVGLAAAMIGGSATLAVSATPIEEDNTYNYVAFGDSIAAGFGLTGGNVLEGNDPTLILTQDLIDNPLQAAYPAIFGDYLKELGAGMGVDVTTTNLSCCAYRAMDVEGALYSDDYVGEIALSIFGKSSYNALKNYHNLFMKYLPDADLVSVQLGGNDIIMGVIVPMTYGDNPILESIGISLTLTLFGCDMTTAIGGGVKTLMDNKDELNYAALKEAAEFFSSVSENTDMYVDIAAEEVGDVVDAIRTINTDADVALIGMFNPYGNSLEYNGKTYTAANVVTSIFKRAAEEICGEKLEEPDVDIADDEDIEDKADESSRRLKLLAKLSAQMENIEKYSKKAADKIKKQMMELLTITIQEISYPIQYLTAGNISDERILSLNEKLSTIADEKGCTFVDVYGISNENNLDPHPNANGHQEIADILESELHDLVCEGMEADRIPLPLENTSTISAASVTAGTKVTITGAAEGGSGEFLYTYQIKKPGNSSWTTLGEKYGTATSKVFTAKLEGTYEVRVLVKDGTGTVKSFKTTVNSTGSILKNNSTISATTANVGEKVTLTAVAEGGTEPYRYTYEYKKPGDTKFKTIGKRGAQYPSVQFSIETAGTYEAKVYIQDDTDYTTVKTFTVEVPELE